MAFIRVAKKGNFLLVGKAYAEIEHSFKEALNT